MARTLAATVALTALLGFAVGWFAFSTPMADRPKVATTTSPTSEPSTTPHARVGARASGVSGVVDVVQRFAMRPADVAADRETTAVAVAPDGTVVMAWASQAEAGASTRTLYLARSSDGGATFSTPIAWRTVPIYKFTSDGAPKARKMAFSTHVLPRLASTRDGLALGWVEAIDGGPTVRFLVARSRDNGTTFSTPVAAHGGDARRPGFTAVAATPGGGLACGWIDSRDQGQRPFFSTWPADSDGFAPERLVFAGTDGKGICPCCDVAVAVTSGGGSGRKAFVAFRNSDSGHRDIWLAQAGVEGSSPFAAPIPVAQEPWTFDGCPHDGPSLAVAGDRLHVAWMDAHTGVGRVYHAAATVDDLGFRPRPIAPQTTASQGHPKLVAGGDGRLHAVWDEGLNPEPTAPAKAKPSGDEPSRPHHPAPTAGGIGGRAIMYAVSRDGGASFTPPRTLAPSPGAYQVQPSLALAPEGTAFVAWNEIDQDGKHAVLVRLANPK